MQTYKLKELFHDDEIDLMIRAYRIALLAHDDVHAVLKDCVRPYLTRIDFSSGEKNDVDWIAYNLEVIFAREMAQKASSN